MPESEIHKRAKHVICGCAGAKVEHALPRHQRLDCVNRIELSCGEVELTRSRIPYAVSKLKMAERWLNCQNANLVVRPGDYAYALSLAPKPIRVVRLTHVPVGACRKPQH